MIQLDYAVDTDLSGRAHRQTELVVTPSQLPGAVGTGKLGTPTLELSYDDGATWRPVRLQRSGSDWKGQVDAPSRAVFASLRATIRDSAGNSVSQTVDRAFGLR